MENRNDESKKEQKKLITVKINNKKT